MNYNETHTIKDHFTSLGYSVELSESKSSDYLRLTRDSDKYNMKFVIRLSDHDALTGRSACADESFLIPDLKDTWMGKFESKISIDEDGDVMYGEEVEFDTEDERDEYLMTCIIKEIENNINF